MQLLRLSNIDSKRRKTNVTQSQNTTITIENGPEISPHHGSAKGCCMPRMKWFLILVAICVATTSPLSAQDWSGNIGAAYLWQNVDGNEDAYRTQFDLHEGFNLEDLNLLYTGDGAISKFTLDAWGFGDANPAEAARLDLDFGAGFGLFFNYDRRDSFFNLAGSDFAVRQDDWEITRYQGGIEVDAWRPLQITLDYRAVDREGTARRTVFGLNEMYPVGIDLDESMHEWTLRLATRTLPVRLEFEQSIAAYTRKNRPFATGDDAIGGDPDALESITSNVIEEMDGVPTTRVVASYSSKAFEGVVSLLWRSAELDINGTEGRTFLIGGGTIGTWEMVDQALGSAEQDTFAGAVSLGFKLARRWTLRLSGDYRDGSSNSEIATDRVSRITSPLGSDITWRSSYDDNGFFDFTDSRARLVLDYRADTWAVWAGGSAASREADWRLSDGLQAYDVERESTGFLVGGSWNPGKAVDLTVELDRGDFDQYIFRIDPETVSRATMKLKTRLGKGWQLDIHGRYVQSDNPPEIAELDTEATPYGAAVSWTSFAGKSGFGLDLEQYSLETSTSLLLPDGTAGASIYDLNLSTATLYGHTRSELFGVSGSVTYLEDTGGSWPLDSWTGRLRLTIYGGGGFEYSALVQYWSYDEVLADLDDYDVIRYGLAVNWRFE
jgi:hypothetical protein